VWSYPRAMLEVLAEHVIQQETDELKARFGGTSTSTPQSQYKNVDRFLNSELDWAKTKGLPIEDA